jgi:hypothetical protein
MWHKLNSGSVFMFKWMAHKAAWEWRIDPVIREGNASGKELPKLRQSRSTQKY